MDTEGIGQLTHRGHMRLNFVPLGPGNSRGSDTGTLG
jgi:hypothetical protein